MKSRNSCAFCRSRMRACALHGRDAKAKNDRIYWFRLAKGYRDGCANPKHHAKMEVML